MTRKALSAAALLLLIVLLLLGFSTATLTAVRTPLSLGDYVAIWGLKGRAIERGGSLASVFRVDPDGATSHPEYPPLWPMVLAGFARATGGWDELVLTLLRPFLLVGALAGAAAATRAPPPYRLLAAAAVSLLPYWRSPLYAGYAEPLLVVLLLAALLESGREGKGAALRLAFVLALAALTKQEGAWAALVTTGTLVAARRRVPALAALGGWVLGVVPWTLYRHAHASTSLADFSLAAFRPLGVLAAVGALAREAGPAALAVAAVAGGLLALAPRTRQRRRGLLLALGAYLLGLLGAFAFARVDVGWLVRWTWDRLGFVPLVLLVPVLAEALAEALDGPSAEGAPAGETGEGASSATPLADRRQEPLLPPSLETSSSGPTTIPFPAALHMS